MTGRVGWRRVFVLFYHDGPLKVVLLRGKSGVIYIKEKIIIMQKILKLFKNMDNLS